MSVYFEFDEVDTFTAAAIGEPGSRTFYLHARAGQQRVTVKCEKQQVTAIAQYLRKVLSDLPPPEDRPLPVDLRDPGEQSFVLGPIGLGYDRGNDRLLVQLEELVPTALDDEDDEPVDDDDVEDDRRAHPAVHDPQPGRGLLRSRRRAGRRRSSELPVVRQPHRPRRSPVPADELNGGVPVDALAILAEAEIELEGRMPWSSNATFLVNLGDTGGQAIYKPVRGERPLWDFEPGLHRREVAAYLLSEAMGFGVVPPTVLREDGPLGIGSLQWFVDRRPPRALLHDRRATSRAAPPAARHRRARRRGQQHRPQERALPAGRRSGLGHRQRPVLRPRVQAAHRDLGVRRRRPRRRRSTRRRRWICRGVPPEIASLLESIEVEAHAATGGAARRAGRAAGRRQRRALPVAAGVSRR